MYGNRHQLLYFILCKIQELKNTMRQQFVPDLMYFPGFLSMGGLKELYADCLAYKGKLNSMMWKKLKQKGRRVVGKASIINGIFRSNPSSNAESGWEVRDLPQQSPSRHWLVYSNEGHLSSGSTPLPWWAQGRSRVSICGWFNMTWAFPYASHPRQTQKNIY